MPDFFTPEQRRALCSDPRCVEHTPDGDAFCAVPRDAESARSRMEAPSPPGLAGKAMQDAEPLTATANVVYMCGCHNTCTCEEEES